MKTGLLLSGGMDSIALAWWFRPDVAYTVDYGQVPAKAEIRAASSVAEALSISHRILTVDLSKFGTGDLAGATQLAMAPVREWWPFRNQALVTVAAMAAISEGIDNIMIGTLVSDGTHADGTLTFVNSLSHLLQIQEGNLRLTAPAITLTASELIRRSQVPLELLCWAHSCHVANEACGECRGCQKHADTFAAIGHEPY